MGQYEGRRKSKRKKKETRKRQKTSKLPIQSLPPPPRYSLRYRQKKNERMKKKIHIIRSFPNSSRHFLPLFPGKSLVEQRKNFWYIELNIFEVEFVLVVLLHFQKIVKLQVEFK